jgi:DMSO/TMAO reductase YedYZ heme-binding membrane subunit
MTTKQNNSSTNDNPLFGPEASETFWGVILGGLIGLGLAVAGLIIGIGVLGINGKTQAFWYLSRSAGFVAYLLLWGSVVWGLLLTSKIGKGTLRPPTLLDAHQFLSNIALGFVLFHGLVLMGDRFTSFPLQAVLVPFASTYQPVLVAVGQLGMWLMALLILSFYVRRRIGQKVWRWLHYGSFVAYWFALGHSLILGPDTNNPWIQLMYLVTAGTVLYLTFYRMLASDRRNSKRSVTAS